MVSYIMQLVKVHSVSGFHFSLGTVVVNTVLLSVFEVVCKLKKWQTGKETEEKLLDKW